GFGRGCKGGWLRFFFMQDLRFPRKVLQCACQGDAKRRGPRTRASCLDSTHLGRQTKRESVPSPCSIFFGEPAKVLSFSGPSCLFAYGTNCPLWKFRNSLRTDFWTSRSCSG